MSSCFKCGKELLEGMVECEGGDCVTATGAAAPKAGLDVDMQLTSEPIILIQVRIDPSKACADREAYFKAVSHFSTMLGKIAVSSGLQKFMKKDS